MRALITGINGMDGSYLADLLLSKGYNVFGMERRTSSPNRTNTKHLEGKITFLNGEAYPSTHGSLTTTNATADHACFFFGGFSSLGTAHTNTWAYVTNNSGNNNAFFEFDAEL